MKPLQRLDGYGHMLLAGTVRTGKSHRLAQLMWSVLETPLVLPATPLPPPALEQDVQAGPFTPSKDPL
jgi:hypothetical protein